MKTKTQEIYVSDDGKEFTSAIECEKYEAQLKEEEKTTSYWRVVNQPDLTEGRGHYGLLFIKVRVPEYDNPELYLLNYRFRKFGRPIAFVQGCSPISNWVISKIDKGKYLEGGQIKVGDYSYEGAKLSLSLGERETGLIEKS